MAILHTTIIHISIIIHVSNCDQSIQQVISLGAAIDNTVERYVKYELHQAYVIQKIISSQKT